MTTNVRGIYDYGSIVLNGELQNDEILLVLAHELGHEYFALHTNLGQLGWILNNLSYVDLRFLNSYKLIHNLTNKNEEKFCVLFEVLLSISSKGFENNNEVIDAHGDYLKKYLNRDYDFFTSILVLATKDNFNSIAELFKVIISYSIVSDLPKIPFECLINSNKLQSLLKNVSCKSKLKNIIKFCNNTTGNKISSIDISDLTKKITNNFPIKNTLPDIGSISLEQNDAIILQYESEKNKLVRDYKENNEKIEPLFEDIVTSGYIANLLIILSEEQEKQRNENPLDRILFFKKKSFVSNVNVVKDKREQLSSIGYANQVTFITPYKNKKNSTIFNIKTAAYKVLGYYINDGNQVNNKVIHDPFVFENLKFEQLENLFTHNSSYYADEILNLLVRLTPQNNNSRYLKTLANNFIKLNDKHVNIFICNPQSQIRTLLDSFKNSDTDITYMYSFSDEIHTLEVKTKHSTTFRITLIIEQQSLIKYNFKLGSKKPSDNEKIIVSVFKYLLNESDIVNQLNARKLFV